MPQRLTALLCKQITRLYTFTAVLRQSCLSPSVIARSSLLPGFDPDQNPSPISGAIPIPNSERVPFPQRSDRA